MRGCLLRVETKRKLKKGESTWRLVLSLGRGADGKQKQKWITFHGTRKQAEEKLGDMVGEVRRGEFVEPTKLTVATYLNEWLQTTIRPRLATNTYESYSLAVRKYLIPTFGHLTLQGLSVLHVERYYAASTKLSQATLLVHHAVLRSALGAAVKKGLLRSNVATRATNKPHVSSNGDVLGNVWTSDEAKTFLTYVKAHGTTQEAALFALALDTGARKGELLGLQWKDLQDGIVRFERQLLKDGKEPVFGQPKRGAVRSIDLSPDTLAMLQTHKREQAEVKMKNRLVYHDFDLVFAQPHEPGKRAGTPLNFQSVNSRLVRLCSAARVKEITAHGLRHTCATLLLASGVPPHVVQRRLGHKRVEMTLNVYSHVLPSMQQDATAKLAALLH